ncbi:unnamed protein product [Soboliphyme baturini]|uniref:Metalloendopeptidase n=1 Tax=Soboliphyme baturini TaxID=241478 RepID=A0A3P8EV29_9BILA|nr:unnamed protein product [Soboliphyme baturini]
MNSALNPETFPERLWHQQRVPYVLGPGLTTEERSAIAQAFIEFSEKTCVRFVPKTKTDQNYIVTEKNYGRGCSSYVGRNGGNQSVSLEVNKCFRKGTIQHELMHVLGFFHEHSRMDRDDYVKIEERNIAMGMRKNFEKYSKNILHTLGMPYDYQSIMHYHALAFSKNGKPTVIALQGSTKIGQRYNLSEIDVAKVNKLYNCSKLPLSSGSANCTDLVDHCRLWAELGHCKFTVKYMRQNCKITAKKSTKRFVLIAVQIESRSVRIGLRLVTANAPENSQLFTVRKPANFV